VCGVGSLHFFLHVHICHFPIKNTNEQPKRVNHIPLFSKKLFQKINIMSPVPLATASSIDTNSFDGMQVKRSRTTFTHSPVVMAMITNNRLTNCRDVSAMMKECQASESGDQLCRTASNYFDMCMESGRN
jgi:hypothetical protein